jgi:hypothetical protein
MPSPEDGRDDARGVAGQHHVAAIVPFVQRLQRDRRAFLADRGAIGQAGGLAQIGGGLLQVDLRTKLPMPTLADLPCGKTQP